MNVVLQELQQINLEDDSTLIEGGSFGLNAFMPWDLAAGVTIFFFIRPTGKGEEYRNIPLQ